MESLNPDKQSTELPSRPGLNYGYIIVAVCFLMTMFGWGIFYIYGVFFGPLENAFSWSRAVTSGAFSLAVIMSGIAGIVAGRLSDRFGPKIIIIACGIVLAAGYILMSLIQNVWQFYLTYGLLISIGVGGFWSPPVSTVARWFPRRRGLVTGIVSGGISFGTLMLPPVVTQLIDAFDWRVTYIMIGVAILLVVMVASQFLKPNPPETAYLPVKHNSGDLKTSRVIKGFSLSEAIRTRQFWMVVAIYICFGMIQLSVMVHIVPHTTGLNISAIHAAAILSVVGGVSFAGRIIVGIITDKMKAKSSAILCLTILGAAMIWLQFSNQLWQFYLFAVFFGFGYGGLSCLQSLIAAELYGLTALGVITAIFSLGFDVGGAIGPVLSGFIFDISDSYRWAFLICILVSGVALLIGSALKPPERPVRKK